MLADIVNGDADVVFLIGAIIAVVVAVIAGARRAWEFCGVAVIIGCICFGLVLATGP
jgi:hypothetical protein